MGYDMHTVDAMTDEERVVYEAARSAFEEACAQRDRFMQGTREYRATQETVEDAYDALFTADKTYYRLNISGMSATRRIMITVGGMLKAGSEGEWPKRPESIEEELYWLLDENGGADEGPDDLDAPQFRRDHPAVTDEIVKIYREHQEALRNVRSAHNRDESGIAINKLGSNDGWIVTPGECLSAVGAWENASKLAQKHALLTAVNDDWPLAEVRSWFERWVEWLKFAATRGGFEVY